MIDGGAGGGGGAATSDKYVPQSIEDMRMDEGAFVTLEYLEQSPLFYLQIGMASHIVTYYRKLNDMDEKNIETLDGDLITLNRNDYNPQAMNGYGGPFLGDIKPGTSITALNNNLFIAPMYRHSAPAQLSPQENSIKRDLYCTFLLIRNSMRKKGATTWSIRKLPTTILQVTRA